MDFFEILNIDFLGNKIINYLYFLISLILGLLITNPLRLFITKLLFNFFAKDESGNDNIKFDLLLKKPIRYFLFLVVVYFSSKFINLPDYLSSEDSVDISIYISKAFNLFILITIFWTINRAIDFLDISLRTELWKPKVKSMIN